MNGQSNPEAATAAAMAAAQAHFAAQIQQHQNQGRMVPNLPHHLSSLPINSSSGAHSVGASGGDASDDEDRSSDKTDGQVDEGSPSASPSSLGHHLASLKASATANHRNNSARVNDNSLDAGSLSGRSSCSPNLSLNNNNKRPRTGTDELDEEDDDDDEDVDEDVEDDEDDFNRIRNSPLVQGSSGGNSSSACKNVTRSKSINVGPLRNLSARSETSSITTAATTSDTSNPVVDSISKHQVSSTGLAASSTCTITQSSLSVV